jgi:hypothetical protein
MAYVGDWVLYSGTGPNGFKVYSPKAFETSFQKQAERMLEVVERMEKRADDEDADEEADEAIPSR